MASEDPLSEPPHAVTSSDPPMSAAATVIARLRAVNIPCLQESRMGIRDVTRRTDPVVESIRCVTSKRFDGRRYVRGVGASMACARNAPLGGR
ncbi:hypothetical protein GCM10010276_51530 [Streptomyces longisporus]|uniref:Uncharacterized protein n=1 Tax=Streptomyces longisporus TaxID=1948 RepID=A0ABN3MHJ3_STRLO